MSRGPVPGLRAPSESFRYFGGKNHLYQAIINLIPRHRRFVEAFAGSAAVARHLARSDELVLVERDPAQADWLRRHLPHARVRRCDALKLLAAADSPAGDRDAVLFVDPPYPIGDRRDPRARYRCELTDAQHLELAKVILPAKASVLVCGLPWGLYPKLYASWRRHEFPVVTRGGKPGVEVVWTNFADPFPLHDYRYWGADKQQRQDLNRKVGRLIAKMRALDRHEREALRRAIVREFGA